MRVERRSAALRGIGDFKPGMVVQSATVLLNIALAPALMFGWGTGHPLGVAVLRGNFDAAVFVINTGIDGVGDDVTLAVDIDPVDLS